MQLLASIACRLLDLAQTILKLQPLVVSEDAYHTQCDEVDLN